jgi:hypothetical protein
MHDLVANRIDLQGFSYGLAAQVFDRIKHGLGVRYYLLGNFDQCAVGLGQLISALSARHALNVVHATLR